VPTFVYNVLVVTRNVARFMCDSRDLSLLYCIESARQIDSVENVEMVIISFSIFHLTKYMVMTSGSLGKGVTMASLQSVG